MDSVGSKVSKVMDYKLFGKDMKIILLICAILFVILVGSGYVVFKKTGGVTPLVEMIKKSGGNPKIILETMKNKENKIMDDLKL